MLRLGPEDTFSYQNFFNKAYRSNESSFAVDVPPTKLMETLITFI